MTTTANPDELLEAASELISAMDSPRFYSCGECMFCDWFALDGMQHSETDCPYLRLKAAVVSAKLQADVALPSIEEMSGLLSDWNQGAAPSTRP